MSWKKISLGIGLGIICLCRAEAWSLSSVTITTVPFQVGEYLEFDVYWGVIHAGQATLEVSGIVEVSSQPAYHFVSQARTNRFLDTFYKVRDSNQSWMAVNDRFSLGYTKRLREGRFRRDEEIRFDLVARRFYATIQNKNGEINIKEGPLLGNVQDVLSSLYSVRLEDLEVGKEIVFDVNTMKNWPLVVRVLKREEVEVPAGRFDCFLVEPFLREEGIFVQKGKKLEVWFTADERKMPVMMRSEIFIGSVWATLMRYRLK